MRLRRRDLLRGAVALAAAGGAAVGIDGFCITPTTLDVSHHRLGRTDAEGGAIDTAGGGDRIRVAQVSDLHLHAVGSLELRLLEAIGKLRPDLLVLTGDSIDTAAGLGPLAEFLAACPGVPHRLAILGNWEYSAEVPIDRLRALHEQHGFQLLVNRSVRCEVGGRTVRVTGLDDLRHGRPDAAAALRNAEPCEGHLVLAHCPALRDRHGIPPEHRPEAILAGHTHGGQISPGGMALVLPSGSGRYVQGWYREGGPPLFVSRGIGTSTIPIRLGSLPELACIDWRLDGKSSGTSG